MTSDTRRTILELPLHSEREAEVKRLLGDVLRHVRPVDVVTRELLKRTQAMLTRMENDESAE